MDNKKEFINDILHNDEVSTNEELRELFIEELGYSEEEADFVVAQRDEALIDMHYVVKELKEESE